MKTERMLRVTLPAIMFALVAAAAPTDPLEAGFLNPPYSAKLHTWWHWMNGSLTKAGIAADILQAAFGAHGQDRRRTGKIVPAG